MIWQISNILSLIRIPLSVPLVWAIFSGNIFWIFTIYIIALITDFLDGFLARKLNQTSELGKMLDPLGDKVFTGTAVVALFLTGALPLWFLIALVAKDLLILLGGFYVKRKINYVMPSVAVGKVAAVMIAVFLLGIALDLKYFDTIGIYITLFFMIYSFLIYYILGIKALKNKNKQ